MQYRHLLLAAASAVSLISSTAYAQDAAQVDEIVVTGTRIEGARASSPWPRSM